MALSYHAASFNLALPQEIPTATEMHHAVQRQAEVIKEYEQMGNIRSNLKPKSLPPDVPTSQENRALDRLVRGKVPVIVLFRIHYNGRVVALFPEMPGDEAGDQVEGYDGMNHFSADYPTVMRETQRAMPEEYHYLLQRIRQHYGYQVQIAHRASETHHTKRRANAANWYTLEGEVATLK